MDEFDFYILILFVSVIFLVAFISFLVYAYKCGKENEANFLDWRNGIILKYGEPTLEINQGVNIGDYLILVFDQARKIVIHQNEYDYSDILDFSVDGQPSYTTTTSTGSMIGRGIVGGIVLGGVGALAGAATSKKNTTSEIRSYRITIYLKNIQKPVEDFFASNLETAQQVEGILRIIIDSNRNLEH